MKNILIILAIGILILYILKSLEIENFYNIGTRWNQQNGLPIGADFAVTNSNAQAWITNRGGGRGPIHLKRSPHIHLNSDSVHYKGHSRKIDELWRASQHGWIPKEQIGHLSKYYDQQRFYSIGELVHTTNEEFRLSLWGEINPDQYIYHYLAKKGGGCSGGPESIPLQYDKQLDQGDMVTIPGYSGRFRAHILDLAPTYTFQPNAIGSRGGPIPFKTSYCS